ncbi:hypothetical protein [Terrarubrum flagellatum]|uniref:hypothetical protein n=1 Tax=Terrirubrum flagellatum TaxID=2895980 RepID=UPI0031452850
MTDERHPAEMVDDIARADIAALIDHEFAIFDVHYAEKRDPRKAKFRDLSKQVDKLQKAGKKVDIADQMRNEAK